jgi:hypothetical protein
MKFGQPHQSNPKSTALYPAWIELREVFQCVVLPSHKASVYSAQHSPNCNGRRLAPIVRGQTDEPPRGDFRWMRTRCRGSSSCQHEDWALLETQRRRADRAVGRHGISVRPSCHVNMKTTSPLLPKTDTTRRKPPPSQQTTLPRPTHENPGVPTQI